jgi:hypothetical protein
MNRDYLPDIDRLGRQLNELRNLFTKQASDAANDAASYAAPRMRQFSRQLQREAPRLVKAASRNPSAATGVIVGAMVVGAAFAWLLSASGRERES